MNLDEQNSETPDEADALEQRLNRLWADEPAIDESGAAHSVAGYRVLNVLGRGAFGIVYLAEHQLSGKKVALKVPRPEVLIDAEKRKRFASEAALAVKLKHEWIVETFEADISGPTPYIAASYCNGPNLAEWLQSRSEPPPWKQSARLIAKIADAVQYAHSQGISHRDLKPANIMLVSNTPDEIEIEQLDNCIPKVTDFGLAKLSDPTMTDTKSSLLIGTPSYMSPEQMDYHHQTKDTESSDIYALGVILFELLTKQLPIAGESYFEVLDNIRTSTPMHLRSIRKDLPRGLAKICSTCLQKNPSARYPSASALANDLRLCADEKPVAGKRTSLFKNLAYWGTHPNRIRTAGAYTLVSQAIILLWFYVSTASLCFFDLINWQQYSKIMLQDAMVIVTSSSVMCWAGWIAYKGNRLGLWVAAALTALILPLSILPLLGSVVLFAPVYADQPPYFSFVIHMVPATGFFVQAFVLTCGLIASVRKK